MIAAMSKAVSSRAQKVGVDGAERWRGLINKEPAAEPHRVKYYKIIVRRGERKV